jgi:hypothetical protein
MYRDRIRDTTTTTGTGTVTLSGTAPSKFFAFNTLPVGTFIDYVIEADSGGEVEVGRGRVLASNQLSRDEVHQSSNAGSLVNLSAGTKTVFLTVVARSVMTLGKLAARPYGLR